MNSNLPSNMDWATVSENGVDLVFKESRVVLFTIRQIVVGGWLLGEKKFKYRADSPLQNPADNNNFFTNTYNTLDEAKASVLETMSGIMRPSREETAEIERQKERDAELSWLKNPDRSGGQFTADEINNPGWY